MKGSPKSFIFVLNLSIGITEEGSTADTVAVPCRTHCVVLLLVLPSALAADEDNFTNSIGYRREIIQKYEFCLKKQTYLITNIIYSCESLNFSAISGW